ARHPGARVELSVFADSQRPAQPGLQLHARPAARRRRRHRRQISAGAGVAKQLGVGGQQQGRHRQAPVRRFCASAAAWQTGRRAETGEPDGGEPPPRRTAFHCLAEAGWLESSRQLLRLTGQPEFWLLGQPEPEGGRTAPGRLRAWLEQLDGGASRLQGQEDSVVKVRSWRTPSGADLVFMTTNKEKADTPLEQDLSIFPHLEVGQWRSTPTKETACAQTEVGRSIEDLLDSQTASAAVAAIATTAATSPRPTRCPSCSTHRPMRCGHSSSSSSSKQLEHASWIHQHVEPHEDAARLAPAWEAADDEAFPAILARPGAGKLGWGAAASDGEPRLTTRAAACLGQRAEPTSSRAPEEAEELPVQAERSNRVKAGGAAAAAARSKEDGRDWQHMSTAENSASNRNCRSLRRLRGARPEPGFCLLVCRGLPPDGATNAVMPVAPRRTPCLPQWQAKPPAALLPPLPLPARLSRLPAPIPGSPLRRLAEVSEEPSENRKSSGRKAAAAELCREFL
uniref:ANK_REP_REGION domain-containing protein n=1 Tax=Macrostomum lignano TaxID=282301 RepID=A0A1I8FNW4_9PLAT